MLRRNSQTESPTGSPLRAVSVKRKVLYASVTLLLFLGGAELAARLFSDSESGRFRQISEIVSFLSAEESTQILEADAETFWKLRPNVVIDQPKSILFQGRVSNSLGYRNEELTLARPETTTRIVCFVMRNLCVTKKFKTVAIRRHCTQE